MVGLVKRPGQIIVGGAAWLASLIPSACSADDQTVRDGDKSPVTLVRSLPPGAKDFVEARNEMVTRQIQGPRDGRTPVRDERVCAAMRAVPRHEFVPDHLRGRAYVDSPLPIGHEQTISQPYIVALMTELLEITADSKVLEIGTGSGYQAAVLAHLTPHVYTIEIVEPLAERAAKTLRAQGYDEVECRSGDGYGGWPEQAPFDGIIVTCAPEHVPPALWEQLKPGGRMVIPVGGQQEVQRLEVITKTENGERRSRTVLPVRFVPLTRDKKGEAADQPADHDKP
jgi:protein-L-isoaspartate(D-aspartate) O-methyltransferase